MDQLESVRVDRWLCAARIFQSRTQAARACDDGRVKINGVVVKASHVVKVGDQIGGKAPRGIVLLLVQKLAEKRLSPPLARELYEDRSPPPERDDFFGGRAMGGGRPTKREGRLTQRLRGR